MSTRSIIAAKLSDGTIKAIYVHYDGYGHLPILQEHYNTQEMVDALVNLGDLSSLGESLLACKAYNEDEPALLNSFDEVKDLDWGQEYVYLWDGSWSMAKVPSVYGTDECSEEQDETTNWEEVLNEYDKGNLSREYFLELLKNKGV